MDGYSTLYEMLEVALKQAGEESGMLLGQDLSIALNDSLRTTKQAYFGELEDACFVIGVESREAYSGCFYLVFSLRDAIVLSSVLLGIPPARIKEKKTLSIIEDDDIDAFSEIANMINGAFNTVFQGTLSNKVHLKLLAPKKYIPEVDQLSDEEPLPDGDFLMFRSRLEMPGQELNYLDVLMPVDLGDQFDPPVEAPAVEPKDAQEEVSAAGSAAPEPATEEPAAEELSDLEKMGAGVTPDQNGAGCIVVLEDDEEERQQMVNAVELTGYEVVEGTLNADLKELFARRNVLLVMIGSLDADDRELAVCIKINAIRQDSPPPIIMSARRWTRTAVLKALKYGARDIIIKPCGEDELTTKIRRYCRLPVQ